MQLDGQATRSRSLEPRDRAHVHIRLCSRARTRSGAVGSKVAFCSAYPHRESLSNARTLQRRACPLSHFFACETVLRHAVIELTGRKVYDGVGVDEGSSL